MEILILHRQGNSIKEISRKMNISRNTVRKFLRSKQAPTYEAEKSKASKLDPFKEYLLQRVAKAAPHSIPATVLIREIQEQGYQGKITILKDFLHKLKKGPAEEKVIRFETEPGSQAQVDWSILQKGKLYAFAMILGFSRSAYVEFVERTHLEQLLICHENAFEYFGGTCRDLLYDNMKTVVIERNKYAPGKHGFQQTFWDFAKHWGFVPKLCSPYRAQTKGKVERFIGYMKHSFYYPTITKEKDADLPTLNFEVKTWLSEIAAKRFLKERGTTPEKLFSQENRHLLPLAPVYQLRKSRSNWYIDIVQPHDLSIYEKVGGLS